MTQNIICLTFHKEKMTIIKMEPIRRTLILRDHREIPLGEPIGVENQNSDFFEAIRALHNEDYFQNADILVTLPTSKVTTRIVEFPFSDRHKIELALPHAMEEFLAYPIDEAHFTFTPIDQDNTMTRVLAWSIRKSDVERFLELLEQVELDARALYTQSVALSAAVGDGNEEKGIGRAVLEVHDQHSILIVKKRNIIIQQRVINFGLEHLIETAIQKTKLDREGCSLMLTDTDNGEQLPDVHENLLSEIFDELKNELLRTMKAIVTQAKLDDIQQIEICGSLACSQSVMDILNKDFEIDIKSLQTQHLLLTNKGDTNQTTFTPSLVRKLTSTFGLCVLSQERSLYKTANLRRGDFIYQKDITLLRGKLIGTAVLVLLVFILGLSSLYYRVGVWEDRYNQKKQEIASLIRNAFPGLTNVQDDVLMKVAKQRVSTLTEELKNFGQHEQGRPSTLNILLDLSKNIPQDIVIDIQELSITDDRVELKGEIDTYKSVDLVRNIIQKLPYIQEVKTGKTTKNVSEEVLIFQMTARFLDQGGVL